MIDQTNTPLSLEGSEESLSQNSSVPPHAPTDSSVEDQRRVLLNREKCRRWRAKNVERERLRMKAWHSSNKYSERQYRIANRQRELAARRLWRKLHPEKLIAENAKAQKRKNAWLKAWRAKHPDRNKIYEKNAQPTKRLISLRKRKESAQFVIAERLRARLGVALRRQLARKHKSTFSLLGCSIADFMECISKKFTLDMSWENRHTWHLDHVVPCFAFDLTDPDEQSVCFNWNNFQPLPASENLRKRESIPNPLPSWLPAHIAERITLRSKQRERLPS